MIPEVMAEVDSHEVSPWLDANVKTAELYSSGNNERLSLLRAFLTPRRKISCRDFDGIQRPRVKRCLPFTLDVPIRSNLDYAFPLSIVSLIKEYKACFHGAFIQLFFPHEKRDCDRVLLMPALRFIDWERLQFIEMVKVDTHCRFLNDPRNLIDFTIQNLDEMRYVEVHIDEYFIPGRPGYGRLHSLHENLIIGHDADRREFMMAGYGNDYETSPISFVDFLLAFYHMPKSQLRRRSLRTVRRCRPPTPEFNPATLLSWLTQYITSTVSISQAEMRGDRPYGQAGRLEGTWGLESYSTFCDYITRAARERRKLDLRASRTLWEHKVCMLDRIRFLEEQGILERAKRRAEAYRQVEELARTLRFTAYEYNVDGLLPSYARSLVEGLGELRRLETRILEAVVDEMKF